MKIDIDPSAGFCWGVVRTIELAEHELAKGEVLYSLGEIIHNPVETERLQQKGLTVISQDDFERIRGSKVLIRAHGEPPETYRKAEQYGITLIDATCPVVTKVQERIRRFYLDGYQVIIFGKSEHPEVVGLIGQTNGEAIVITSVEEVETIPLRSKMVLFSQTTMDKSKFNAIKEKLIYRTKELVVLTREEIDFHVKDTICGQVSGREKKIREFAATHDIVLFIAGKNSSNGKVLFSIVKETNPRSYYIEDSTEIDDTWFENTRTIGITGATSTPQWLMVKIKNELENKFNSHHN
ncbi:MAG: 4-hydroxy-3-methylbut-2-enyl diphosphate reductase [Bacteroidetes bacterium]|nr:4-hydroxy-3-methylbut-2-enyl diphosphate reductase [Bacteroidota bacterium]